MVDREKLGLYLWRSAGTESAAASIFFKLVTYLKPEDGYTAVRFGLEELAHASLLRECAKQYVPVRPAHLIRPLTWPSDPRVALAAVNQAERMSIPGFWKMYDLGCELGDGRIVDAYCRILKEEPPHMEWGKQLLRQFRQDPILHDTILAYLKTRPITREYRQVSKERPWE